VTVTESVAFYEPPDRIALNAEGRIIDFLDPKASRANTPEERVRQTYIRNLHYDYGYAKDVMRCGAPISIGSETRQADIAVYTTIAAASQRDQARIRALHNPGCSRGLKPPLSSSDLAM